MENMKEMHRLTSAALQFVQDIQEYAKARGYILLDEEPIIHLRPEDRLSLTITQSIYAAEIDMEITVAGYLEEKEMPDMVVETTFDFLLSDTLTINQVHDLLKRLRDDRTNHFFICIRGSQDDGFCEDEISVVIRKKHHVRQDDTFKQWDAMIKLVKEGEQTNPSFMSLDAKVKP